jgi:hypothetical protein
MDTGISLCGVNYFFRGASQLPGVLGKAMNIHAVFKSMPRLLCADRFEQIKFPSMFPVSSTIISCIHVNYLKRREILATNLPLLLLLYCANELAQQIQRN